MVDKENSWNSKELNKLSQPLIRAISELRDGDQIFLDYDGTIVPIGPDPDNCFLPEESRAIIRKLHDRYQLYIVSGRTLDDLERFTGMGLNFIYLHGIGMSENGKITDFVKDAEKYRGTFQRIKQSDTMRGYEGLRIYDKEYGIVFHLGLVPTKLKEEIIRKVNSIGAENNLEVYRGINLLELKIKDVNKGNAIKKVRNNRKCLIAGDELTDEAAFRMCRECVTVHVGSGSTDAKFSVSNIMEMSLVLKYLAYKP